MQDKQEFHIAIEVEAITAVDHLADASGLSKQKIKQCMQKGCVWLERLDDKKSSIETENALDVEYEAELDQKNPPRKAFIQRLRRAKKVVNTHEVLHFYYDETVLNSYVGDATLIEDFGDYSIWNKPSGMLSQGSKWGDHCTIYRWAEKHLHPERPAFIVHRLDRAANGLIILAHKKKVASQFAKLFEKREIEKRYQVSVAGDFSSMLLAKEKLTIDNMIDGKTAMSHISILSFNQKTNTSLLEVHIETGRKHQIRKHLAGIGFPVVGDRLYGPAHNEDSLDLQLQAKHLAFTCPVTFESRSFTLDS